MSTALKHTHAYHMLPVAEAREKPQVAKEGRRVESFGGDAGTHEGIYEEEGGNSPRALLCAVAGRVMGLATTEERGMARYPLSNVVRRVEGKLPQLANHRARLDDILPNLGGITLTTLTRGVQDK